MDEIYKEGNHDFLYVSHVYNKNTHAYNRMKNDYNFLGTPTVWFDGGYRVELGGGPGNKADYLVAIDECGKRVVPDLDLDVDVQWLGNATMNISVTVKNNQTQGYRGSVRVFVTEIVSSLGWKDTSGALYNFPFLDYGFIEPNMIIPAGGTYENSVIWDGNMHNNGYGVTFGNITYENIMVMAVVFTSEWHQGYSYPPNKNPFDAYWVDEADGARPNPLSADAETVPEAGGSVNFGLYGFPENAGRNYLLLGSISGTSPGTILPGGMANLPLNWDLFTNVVVSLLNTSVFSNFMGVLDGNGTANATLNLPPVPGMAGTTMYFAYALNNKWDYVSNPVSVEIIP